MPVSWAERYGRREGLYYRAQLVDNPSVPRFLCSVTLLLAAGALVAAGSAGSAGSTGSTGSTAKKVQILGFTNSQWYPGVPPQVKSGGKITTCLDSAGQRQIAVIFRVTGYPKSARINVGLWGGNGGSQGTSEPKPTLASLVKGAKPRSAASAPTGAVTAISYGKGPNGPVNIDGRWNASVVVDGKVRATGHVTVACP